MGPIDTVVPESVCNELLPVLREAVSNIARHAYADHAEIVVQADAGEVVLQVTDDGVGLPEHPRESGLRNARRRAKALGGTMELTALDPGTRFVWRVPLA
jgi:signal transduction histidine kinase